MHQGDAKNNHRVTREGRYLMNTVKWALIIGAGYFIYRKMAAPLEAFDKTVNTLTRPVAQALAEVQFLVNGSHYIKSPNSEFYLNSDKLDSNYKVIDKVWLKAIYLKHDDNGDLIEEIFDPYLRLKPKYYPLLNGLVDATTVNSLK